jgi:hypothetical protein
MEMTEAQVLFISPLEHDNPFKGRANGLVGIVNDPDFCLKAPV